MRGGLIMIISVFWDGMLLSYVPHNKLGSCARYELSVWIYEEINGIDDIAAYNDRQLGTGIAK